MTFMAFSISRLGGGMRLGHSETARRYDLLDLAKDVLSTECEHLRRFQLSSDTRDSLKECKCPGQELNMIASRRMQKDYKHT